MKKYLIILLTICGIHSAVFSQTKGSFTLGFGTGYVESNVIYPFKVSYADESAAFSQSSAARSINGLDFGVSGEYYFSERWSINGGLAYYQKGAGNIFLSNTATASYPYHLNYLMVPVMMGFHFGAMKNWYANFGVYAGSLSNISAPPSMAEGAKAAFNTEDSGLSAGMGVKFPLSGRIRLFIELDGQLGLEDILKNSGGDNPVNINKNINAGLNFAIK